MATTVEDFLRLGATDQDGFLALRPNGDLLVLRRRIIGEGQVCGITALHAATQGTSIATPATLGTTGLAPTVEGVTKTGLCE